MTSAEMLQRTYLRFIEEEATAKRARAQIRPGDWSMVKRVDQKQPKSQLAHLSLCRLVTYDFKYPGQRKILRRLTKLDRLNQDNYSIRPVLNIIHYAIFIIFTSS